MRWIYFFFFYYEYERGTTKKRKKVHPECYKHKKKSCSARLNRKIKQTVASYRTKTKLWLKKCLREFKWNWSSLLASNTFTIVLQLIEHSYWVSGMCEAVRVYLFVSMYLRLIDASECVRETRTKTENVIIDAKKVYVPISAKCLSMYGKYCKSSTSLLWRRRFVLWQTSKKKTEESNNTAAILLPLEKQKLLLLLVFVLVIFVSRDLFHFPDETSCVMN